MKAFVVDHIHEDGVELLSEFAEVTMAHEVDTWGLKKTLQDKSIFIGRSTPNTPFIRYPVLEQASKLKVIGFASVGLDRINHDYVKEKKITIEYLPGINTQSVTEYAFALMLACRRHVITSSYQVSKGNWNKHGFMNARDIYGNTLGIIGLGRIGTNTAYTAKNGFNMDVLAYDPYVNEENCITRGAKKCNLEMLLRSSDVVLIHAPLTNETYHLIGEKELSWMKRNSLLINVGRGGIINEKALYYALIEKEISHAALDVQEKEPFYKSPLLQLDNFTATPHLAGLTKNYYEKAGLEIVRKCLLRLGIEEKEIVAAMTKLRKRGN
jgi:D-3-phosphoglycerate dehydrogenase